MIDTVYWSLQIRHAPVGIEITEQSPNSTVPRTYRKRVTVISESGIGALEVHSQFDGSRIRFRGSPIKFVQGHNVCGPNDLERILFEATRRALHTLGIEVREAKLRRAVKEGNLSRVDVAVGFRCGSESQVSAALSQLPFALRGSRYMISSYFGESVYVRNRSGYRIVKLYDKRKAIEKLDIKEWELKDLKDRELLLKYARRLIRFEVSLLQPLLKRSGLDTVHQWHDFDVREFVLSEIDRLKLSSHKFVNLSAIEKEIGSGSLKRLLTLWYFRDDFARLYSHRTLATARRDLAKLGIDIDSRPAKNGVEEFSTLFTRENIRASAPRSLRWQASQ